MTQIINPNYEFPEYYSWPYFFTLQKHEETKKKQIKMWVQLTLKFCEDNKVWRLSKSQFYENLGKNNKIGRKVSLETIEIIFQSMVNSNKAAYVSNKSKDEIFVLWKTLKEWEDFIYESAVKRKSINKLETLDYICYDEDNKYEDYYQMDRDLLILLLKELEKEKKCSLLTDDNNSYIGVKFYQ